MQKIKSRKLWAWIIWTIITGLSIIFAKEYFAIVIPWYGGVTMIYVGGQSAIDFLKKQTGGENEK